LIARDNTVLVALYTMEKQKGAWRINGCQLAPSTVRAAWTAPGSVANGADYGAGGALSSSGGCPARGGHWTHQWPRTSHPPTTTAPP